MHFVFKTVTGYKSGVFAVYESGSSEADIPSAYSARFSFESCRNARVAEVWLSILSSITSGMILRLITPAFFEHILYIAPFFFLITLGYSVR